MPLDLTNDKSTLVQVMAWANFDPYVCRHMVSLGLNEFIDDPQCKQEVFQTESY